MKSKYISLNPGDHDSTFLEEHVIEIENYLSEPVMVEAAQDTQGVYIILHRKEYVDVKS